MSSISGLIDLAALGLIGQKAGFATPIDQQLKQVLEVVATALKDASENTRKDQQDEIEHKEAVLAAEKAERARTELIRRGGWHDGRLDDIAGNGLISELGFGIEEITINDYSGPTIAQSKLAPIGPLGSPDGASAIVQTGKEPVKISPPNATRPAVDVERDYIQSLPVLVLNNFTYKSAVKTEIWTVLAEFAAGLIENKIAHVIVIGDSTSAAKALTKGKYLDHFPASILSFPITDVALELIIIQLCRPSPSIA